MATMEMVSVNPKRANSSLSPGRVQSKCKIGHLLVIRDTFWHSLQRNIQNVRVACYTNCIHHSLGKEQLIYLKTYSGKQT